MAHLNPHIEKRLVGLGTILMGVHGASASLSSATKGAEREAFVRLFLEEFFPRGFRFGHGDITDSHDQKSGQCDIVVEYPFIPSIPLPGGGSRLYLAEGVASVIEVKSDVAGQWNEVLSTASKLESLKRNVNPQMVIANEFGDSIPMFAVGYDGWRTAKTIREKLDNSPVDCVLVIKHGIFVANRKFFGGIESSGAVALWLFITALNEAMSYIKTADPSLLDYAKPDSSSDGIKK